MRVLLDVSTSLAWRRPPVGIVRVEQEFAKFLLARDDLDVRFCRYDAGGQRHVEVSRADVESLLAPSDPAVPARHASPPASPPGDPMRLRVRHRVASGLSRIVDRLPEAVRSDCRHVGRAADDVLRSLYWLALKLARGGDGTEHPPRRDRPTHTDASGFDAVRGGVYVSMGLDWDFNDLHAVWALKRAYGMRAVLFCHDVIPILFPQLTPSDSRDAFATYFVDVAHVADGVVAVSETSRQDYTTFLREVGGPIPNMHVIHSGSDVRARAAGPTAPPTADLVDRPFVLCVGTIEARKNHELLYNLWERLVTTHGDRTPLLVLVGMAGWGTSDLLNRIRLNRTLAGRIVLFCELSDAALFWLYEHCLFTVFPSLYEGWGLPVVESLALGTPCLASNAPSVVEATQNLVPTLDPLDFATWFSHLERWLFDPAALAAARATVRTRFRVGSWREHGESLLALLAEVLQDGSATSLDAPQPDASPRVLRA